MIFSVIKTIMKFINSFFANYKLQNENSVIKTILNKKKCYKIKKNRSQYNLVSQNKILKTVQRPLVFIQDEPLIKLYKETHNKEPDQYLRYIYQMS